MPFSDWIPTEELQTLSKYLIADFAALSAFKILTLYAEFLFPQHHAIIINIELNGLFLLIGTMLLLLIIKIGQIGWKGIWHGNAGIIWA